MTETTPTTPAPTTNEGSSGTTPTETTPSQAAATPESTEAPKRPDPKPNDFSGFQDIDEAVLDMLALQEAKEEEGELPQEPPVVAPPPSEAAPEAAPVTPVETPAPTAPVEPQPPVEAPVPPPPVQPQPAVATPEKAPEVQGQQPAPTQQPAAEEPKTPKPGEFAELAQAVQQQRTALESSLADMYAPNEKQMEEFHTEPQKVLGKLAARLHMEIVQNTLGVLAQNIPSAVNGVIEARSLHDGYENEFYKQWPQLKSDDPAQKNVVMQIARAYAHANPQADSKTRIRQIGAQAMVALNLLPTQAPAAAPAAAPVQPAPVQPQAFAPAGQAAAATAPAVPKKLEGWEAIDASYAESEL